MLDNMRRFVELADIAVRIRDSETDWEAKYNAIFSEDISGALGARGVEYSRTYDGSYEDDVIDFVRNVQYEVDRIRPILAAIAPAGGSRAGEE